MHLAVDGHGERVGLPRAEEARAREREAQEAPAGQHGPAAAEDVQEQRLRFRPLSKYQN